MTRWTIQIQPVPGWSVPPIVRLRGALKVLLRTFGLRCVSILEDDTCDAPAGAATADGADAPVARAATGGRRI